MQSIHRRDISLAALFTLLAFILRLPFRSEYLYHWDSVNFALSLQTFDVRLHQPHPPGYFLYSMLGRLVNVFVQDANSSLTLISLVAGAFGVGGMYLAGAALFDRRVGTLAALLALTSPLHWFYSEVALSYALEFPLVTLVAVLCWRQMSGERRTWFWTALALGVAGGVRPNDLVFLGSLWLASLLPLTWKQRAGSVLVLAAVCAAWFIPMAAMSGGLSGYWQAFMGESSDIGQGSSLAGGGQWKELVLNAGRMAVYVGYGLLLAGLPLLWGAWQALKHGKAWLKERRLWFFALWILPAALFYLIIHIRQHGHIFVFFPALLILAAAAAVGWAASRRLSARMAAALASGVILLHGAFFLLAPTALFGSTQLPLQTPSRNSIASRDTFLGERFDYIRANFNIGHTVVLAGGDFFRHPEYYLADSVAPTLSYELGDELVMLSETSAVILFDEEAFPSLRMAATFERIDFPDGSALWALRVDAGREIVLSRETIVVR